MWFGWFWMMIFWGGIIWFIVWLVNKNNSPQTTDKTKKPIDILNERLAKGNITIKEFKELKKELK
ncbi:electron transporter RnfE [Candidatus Woesearchaeota archaeon]|nr:electron transporter RnfE [Candidatus Woesearchaeota archaeon]